MLPQQPESRAIAVLESLGLAPATRAASGRYQRSDPIRPGVRYWATSQPRLRQDYLGVQFFGRGLREAEGASARLEAAGFQRRTPQTGQLTFAKPVSFTNTDDLDCRAIADLRKQLDAALDLDHSAPPGSVEGSGYAFPESMRNSPLAEVDIDIRRHAGREVYTYTFLDRMAASPLAGLELDDPDRSGEWRPLPF